MIWTDYVMKLQPWKVHLFFVSIDFPQKYIKMFQQYYTCFNSLDIKQNYFRKRLFFFSPLSFMLRNFLVRMQYYQKQDRRKIRQNFLSNLSKNSSNNSSKQFT